MALPIGNIIKGVTKIADDLITTKEEMRSLELEEQKIDAELMQGQMEINKEEAKHKSVFVAGWRPFIGWVGGFAMVYQFILYPLLTWLWAWMQAKGAVSADIGAPPELDAGALFAIITGMLGIGAMRSYDKTKGVNTESILGMTRKEFRLNKRLERLKSKNK